MEFKAKIYIPNTKLNFFQKWALTEQLSFLSLSIMIIMLFLNNFFYIDSDFKTHYILKIIYSLCLVPFILNLTYRYWEFERINGKLEGEISFEANGVKINEKLYLFSEIKDFHISYGNVYHQPTGNKKIGPYLSQGVDNHISFYHNSKFFKTYFQLYSTSQYDAIQKDLFYYVIHEIFPFEKKNLDFIDKQFHHYTLYKEFIEKMKREGKLT